MLEIRWSELSGPKQFMYYSLRTTGLQKPEVRTGSEVMKILRKRATLTEH